MYTHISKHRRTGLGGTNVFMLFESASANFLIEQPNSSACVTAFFCLSFFRHQGLLQGLIFDSVVSSEQL